MGGLINQSKGCCSRCVNSTNEFFMDSKTITTDGSRNNNIENKDS